MLAYLSTVDYPERVFRQGEGLVTTALLNKICPKSCSSEIQKRLSYRLAQLMMHIYLVVSVIRDKSSLLRIALSAVPLTVCKSLDVQNPFFSQLEILFD